jgi:hypothetical protein
MKKKSIKIILLSLVISVLTLPGLPLHIIHADGTTLYWVDNGSHAWWDPDCWSSTPNGTGGAGPPTMYNDAVIGDPSGPGATIVETGGSVCHDLTWATSYIGDFITLSFGSLTIYGNMTLSSNVRIQSGGNTFGWDNLIFAATDGGHTITTGGAAFGGNTLHHVKVIFKGLGGEWILQDNWICKRYPSVAVDIYLVAGTLNTNGKVIGDPSTTIGASFNTFTDQTGSSCTLARSLVTGNSTWYVGDGGWQGATEASGFTLDSGTSSIIFPTYLASDNFQGGGQTYYDVTLNNDPALLSGQLSDGGATLTSDTFHDVTFNNSEDATILENGMYNNLTVNGGSNYGGSNLIIRGDQTINGTLTLAGYNTTTARLRVKSSRNYIDTVTATTLGLQPNFNAAAVDIVNSDISDMVGSGDADWDISGGLNGDLGNNSGITFPDPVASYWVGNSGNWSDIDHWASESGGTGGTGRVPLAQDYTIIDTASLSSSSVITLDLSVLPSIDAAGTMYNLDLISASGTEYAYGNLFVNSGYFTTTYNSTNTYLKGDRAAYITGDHLNTNLYANFYPGADNEIAPSTISGGIYLLSGWLELDGDITAAFLDSSATTYSRQLDLRYLTSLTLNSTSGGNKWNLASTNLTFTPGSEYELILTNSASNGQTFVGEGYTYNNLTVEGAGAYSLEMLGSNTFNTLTIDRSQAAKTVTFYNNNITVDRLLIPVSGTTRVTLMPWGESSYWTITKTSGTVSSNYLNISFSHATGGATFYAGAFATLDHTTGWLNENPPTPTLGQVLWYQPNTMISGTTLPDRDGTQNGVITWGNNPAGIDTSLSGFESGYLARLTDFSAGSGGSIVNHNPGIPSQMYTELNTAAVPGADIITQIFGVSDTPIALWWFPFIFIAIAIVSLLVYEATTVGGRAEGSLLTQCVVIEVLLALSALIGSATGNGGMIPFWPVFLFPIPATALILSRRHVGWG